MVFGQCKSYKLSDKGDTLNCIDFKDRKQGPWIETFPELRGNPGYEAEGEYKNGQREGIWRKFTLQGDVLAVESYSWGLLNGKAQYYSLMGLEREESWWAIDPGQKFDTIDIPDLYTDGIYRRVIVPNEGHSMKHGSWTWYNTMTGRIERSQEFIRDSAVSLTESMGIATKKRTSDGSMPDSANKKVEKPSVVTEWEKKNSGKKKVVVRDGSTGY
jgi:antitoxin component YwqK of YwqJK toxin-antitoxin module